MNGPGGISPGPFVFLRSPNIVRPEEKAPMSDFKQSASSTVQSQLRAFTNTNFGVVALSAFLATVLPGGLAAAQRDPSRASVIRLQIDNDLIGLRGGGPPPDYDYTGGARFSLTMANGAIAFALGQEIYTPRHNTDVPVGGDRPYAGLLYGALLVMRRREHTLDSVELRGGVTGRLALGEQVQNTVHRLLHNALERGWSHQIPARAAVDVRAERSTILFGMSTDSTEPSRFLRGALGGVAGNIQGEIHLSGSAYWGWDPAARA